jgi:heme/copper-type cytochrome/quinol oxidase subunit 2
MLFSVRALPKAQYDAWLANAQRVAAAGTNSELSVYTGKSLGASL